MSAELSNIEAAESLLKFVVERLNNPPENQNEDHQQLYIKQQAFAAYLYALIFNQTSYLSKKSKKESLKTENRVRNLINTLKNQELKQKIITNTLSQNCRIDSPKLPAKNNKKENEALLLQLLDFAVQPLFTPGYNQKWFEMISSMTEKNRVNQKPLENKLKNAIHLNEIHRIAKSNSKAEQKLNSLMDIIREFDHAHKNTVTGKQIYRYIEQILHEQLPKELEEIINNKNIDNPTKLTNIHAKIYNEHDVLSNYIKDESLRQRAMELAKPFIKQVDEAIISDIDQCKDKPVFEQIQLLEKLLVKLKNCSPELIAVLINRKNTLNETTANAINEIVNASQLTVYQKIKEINLLVNNNFTGLDAQIKQALRDAKNSLRRNINLEIETIFNDTNLNSYEKYKQILTISKLMETGSGLQQSYIIVANNYMKKLIGDEIIQFAAQPNQTTTQQLARLNDLTLKAQQLNLLDEQHLNHVKKQNNLLLWKISCELDLLIRQSISTEPPFNVPSEIKQFKLAQNVFSQSQKCVDDISKTFVADILSSKDANEACLKIEQSLIIANHLLHKGCIDGFLAIVIALNNGAITRLKSVFKGLSPQALKLYEKFNIIADAKQNFPALRKVQEAATQSGINVVPSITLLLKDLTFAAEKAEQAKDTIINLTSQFNHCRDKNKTSLNKTVPHKFCTDKTLDESTAYQCSERLEPRTSQAQSPTIISLLQTLVIPHKIKIFDVKIKKIVSLNSTVNTDTSKMKATSTSNSITSIPTLQSQTSSTKNSASLKKSNKPHLSTHTLPAQKNLNSAIHLTTHLSKDKEPAKLVNRTGSLISFESANKILRTSGSYIANVLTATCDTAKYDNDLSYAQTKEAKHESSKIILQSVDKPKKEVAIHDKKPELIDKRKNKSKWMNTLNTLNNLWMGFLGFVGLEVMQYSKSQSKNNPQRSQDVKKASTINSYIPEKQPTAPKEHEAWLEAKQQNSSNKTSGSYTLRLFPITSNRSHLRQTASGSYCGTIISSGSYIRRSK